MKTMDTSWDLVVIGGGITGAGILREAVRRGYKTLLIEQKDFAWGTSSRSSKLVHGGLRYLKEGHFGLTRESVRERDRLLREAPGLVEPLEFRMPLYHNQKPGPWTMGLGLAVYDLISWKWNHRFLDQKDFSALEPSVQKDGLNGGFVFSDAQVDDARLVLRLIFEAETKGGVALNYTRCRELVRDTNGKVVGVVAEDVETGESLRLQAACVVNATGVWAETLHPCPEKNRRIRPLRGSHLVFRSKDLPIKATVSFFNPKDGRALFAIPWEGAVLLGTTDLDHGDSLSSEPRISESEAVYLVDAAKTVFPGLGLSLEKALSSFAGVRPVVSEGHVSADKESRDHAIWKDRGLVTVTGGKLTTFRVLALDTLKSCLGYLPEKKPLAGDERIFKVMGENPPSAGISRSGFRTLWGRYGDKTFQLLSDAREKDLEAIPGTQTLWCEIRHGAGNEKIRHLDDLLLRRVRVGLLTPGGGKAHMEKIRELCGDILPWDDERWRIETDAYFNLWESRYSPFSFKKEI